MAINIQLRRGTALEWSDANPTLAVAEFGLETDTNLFKIGNGSDAWNALAYGGLSGVVAATSPITYDSGTQTVAIDQTAIAVNASQVAITVSDKADNYTVLTSDKNSLIRVTAATDKTVTIGTATAFQVGDRIDILQDGEGVVTVDVTGDATLAGRGEVATAYTIGQQFDAVSVVCVGTNSYRIIGNAEAI
jgi:hypothetical protein